MAGGPVSGHGREQGARRQEPPRSPTSHVDASSAALFGLQRAAGNRAVTALLAPVQRKRATSGWDKADTAGKAWNAGSRDVGQIIRVPVDDVEGGHRGETHDSGSASEALTTETAKGRAIALVPKELKPKEPVDVLLHLHGFAENTNRPFAGWRQHKTKHTVRDVEQDRIAQQMEAAGHRQLLGVLPQGGEKSQFGSMNADPYAQGVLRRLKEIGALSDEPKLGRIVMSAHSGGGLTVRKMLSGGQKGKPGNMAEVVLFEAINGQGDLDAVRSWVLGELNRHRSVLTDPGKTQQDKVAYLQSATRLRAYYDPDRRVWSKKQKKNVKGIYVFMYEALDAAINNWFADHGSELGGFAKDVRALHEVVGMKGVAHEDSVRKGLTHALGALPGGGSTSAPPVPTKVPTTPAPASPAASSAARASTTSLWDAFPRTVARLGFIVDLVGGGLAVLAGAPPLQVAAGLLAGAGLRDEIDLTDALFDLVHPELHGGRIGKGDVALQREWVSLRRTYAKPALAALKAEEAKSERTPSDGTTSTPPGGATGPTPAPKAAPKKTFKPTKGKAASGDLAAKHPALAAEWAQLNGQVQGSFRRGFQQYVDVRGLYEKKLGGSPVPWLNALQFGYSFCGFPLEGLDPRVTTRLDGIQARCQELATQATDAKVPMKFEGAFQPRAVTGKPTVLSDHGVGKALHLNYKQNPYTNRTGKNAKKAAAIIEKIVTQPGEKSFWKGLAAGKGEGKGDYVDRVYRSYAAASDAVARYFREMDQLSGPELDRRKAEHQIVKDAHAGRDPRNGFFAHSTHVQGDPIRQILQLLVVDAGLTWGGAWNDSQKDLHHFALKG